MANAQNAQNAQTKSLRRNMRLSSGGRVAERIAQLLADRSLSLAQVADRVVQGVEGARTTAKSVASVAARLRREGFRVPDRRRRTH